MNWADVVAIASELPEVTESTWFRSPSLKVRGKGFARLRDEAEGGVVVMCSLEEKEALLAAGGAYYTTPHYDGYGAIIVDLAAVDPAEMRELLVEAWRLKAPVRMRKEYDSAV